MMYQYGHILSNLVLYVVVAVWDLVRIYWVEVCVDVDNWGNVLCFFLWCFVGVRQRII